MLFFSVDVSFAELSGLALKPKESVIVKDIYDELDVDNKATLDEIKKSYRKIAMKFHPDRNPGNKLAEEKFKSAAEAYSIASDPEKRAIYDRLGYYGNVYSQKYADSKRQIREVFSDLELFFRHFEIEENKIEFDPFRPKLRWWIEGNIKHLPIEKVRNQLIPALKDLSAYTSLSVEEGGLEMKNLVSQHSFLLNWLTEVFNPENAEVSIQSIPEFKRVFQTIHTKACAPIEKDGLGFDSAEVWPLARSARKEIQSPQDAIDYMSRYQKLFSTLYLEPSFGDDILDRKQYARWFADEEIKKLKTMEMVNQRLIKYEQIKNYLERELKKRNISTRQIWNERPEYYIDHPNLPTKFDNLEQAMVYVEQKEKLYLYATASKSRGGLGLDREKGLRYINDLSYRPRLQNEALANAEPYLSGFNCGIRKILRSIF